MINSTIFNKLKPKQTMYLIRYSSNPYPIYIEVQFEFYDSTTENVEISYTQNNKLIKKKINNISTQYKNSKAYHRLFLDKDEMVKSLRECFIKRKVDLSPIEHLIETSQDNKPEFWV